MQYATYVTSNIRQLSLRKPQRSEIMRQSYPWNLICLVLAATVGQFGAPVHGFQVPAVKSAVGCRSAHRVSPVHASEFQPEGVIQEKNEANDSRTEKLIQASTVGVVALLGTPMPALAAADPISSAAFAWLHFLGIIGVAGGLVAERFLIQKNMSEEIENKVNNADGIYGLSAFSLLLSGYFRATTFAKGWDFYQHEPIFWLKMSSVAVLGGLSFFPAIVFFRRDQARKQGSRLAPISDALVDRITTIINAEILALLSIPLMASLMARGVLYFDNFPWQAGAVIYALSLGGAGYKYGKEAFDMMEAEGALVPMEELE